jgi:type II secretory pathway pseudopilin PulG
MADTTADTDPKNETPKNEAGYLLVVCILLVVISVALAWLWQMQKRRTEEAQRALIEQQRANPLAQFLSQAGQQQPFPKQDAAPETIQFNGHPTPLYKLSAQAGRRIGFEPGDLISVLSDQPTSRPTATDPAPN